MGSKRTELDLNTATFEELANLPMVGKERAEELIRNRPFRRWDDVKRIPGFSSGMVEDLKSGGASIRAAGEQTDPTGLLAAMHEANWAESEIGRLAERRAAAEPVRDLGKTLVQDHENADRTLEALAERKGLELANPPELPSEKKEVVRKLQSLAGEDFDRFFLENVVEAHERSLEMLKSAQGTLEDEDVRSMVQELIPTLERHRKQASGLLG